MDQLVGDWSKISTAYQLLDGFLGAVDGWLAYTEAPFDVQNPADYFSGHYQCFGLNAQAMCASDLSFLFVGMTASGKVNDAWAIKRCTELLDWIESLPPGYFIGADNVYELS